MKKINSLSLCLTFAGCFLGAGYVSGQELWQFFGAYGIGGIAGFIVAIAGKMMLMPGLSKIPNAEKIDITSNEDEYRNALLTNYEARFY